MKDSRLSGAVRAKLAMKPHAVTRALVVRPNERSVHTMRNYDMIGLQAYNG